MRKTLINKIYIRSNEIKQVAISYLQPLLDLVNGEHAIFTISYQGSYDKTYQDRCENAPVRDIISRIVGCELKTQGYYVLSNNYMLREFMHISLSSLNYISSDLPNKTQKTMSEEGISVNGEKVICCEMVWNLNYEDSILQHLAEEIKALLYRMDSLYHCIYGFVHCQNGYVRSPTGVCTRMMFSRSYLGLNGYSAMECYTEGGFWLNLLSPCHIRRIGGCEALKERYKGSMLQVMDNGNVLFQILQSAFVPEEDVLTLENVLKKTLLSIEKGGLRDYSAQAIRTVLPGVISKIKNANIIKAIFVNSAYEYYHEIRDRAIKRIVAAKSEGYQQLFDGDSYYMNTPSSVYTDITENIQDLVDLLTRSFGDNVLAGKSWEWLCRTKLNEIIMCSRGVLRDYNESLDEMLSSKHYEAAEDISKELDPRIIAELSSYPDVTFIFTFQTQMDESKIKKLDAAIQKLAEKSVSSGEQYGIAHLIDEVTSTDDNTQWTLYADMGTVALDDFYIFSKNILKICDAQKLNVIEMRIE